MYTVYAHICKENGKRYIGQTRNSVKKRWNNGTGYSQQPIFYNAIKKYGFNNFEHRIIAHGLTQEQANRLEIKLIQHYKTTDSKYGYNCENGGNGKGKISDETRRKISESRKGKYFGKDNPNYGNHKLAGKNNPNYGCHRFAGENNPFFGKTHTQETIEKIKQANIGRNATPETKAKMSAARKGKRCGTDSFVAKAVVQFDKNGEKIREWGYIKQAQDELNINSSAIIRCCKGKQKTAGGFLWHYLTEIRG